MGLILDTSVLVTSERAGHSVAEILEQMRESLGETQIGLSAVTIVELMHGVRRSTIGNQRQRRLAFVQDLRSAVSVYALTDEIAERAGLISGQEAERGVTLPFADLLIGATALHLGYEVVAENVRHFQMIPDLAVRNLQRRG